MVYECGLRRKALGGLVLKAVYGNFEVAGLHRGKLTKDSNCGTALKDIIKSISGKQYSEGMYNKM